MAFDPELVDETRAWFAKAKTGEKACRAPARRDTRRCMSGPVIW
jgi:hypothetical protein